MVICLLFFFFCALSNCSDDDGNGQAAATSTPTPTPVITITPTPTIVLYTYEIINIYPHDATAFTQGLIYHNGFLYEGTGRYGYSSIRKVDLETGQVLQIRNLDDSYFGEGITIYGDRLIQLTYLERTGFVYDLASFDLLEEFSYLSQGWGLTHDNTNLIMSDGTPYIRYLDPHTYETVKHRNRVIKSILTWLKRNID